MNENIFSLRRFLFYSKAEIINTRIWKLYVILLCMWFFEIFSTNFSFILDVLEISSISLVVLYASLIKIVMILLGNFDKKKDVISLMIPASKFEKLLFIFLFLMVIYPISILLYAKGTVAFNPDSSANNGVVYLLSFGSIFWYYLLTFISLNAFSGLWFKTVKRLIVLILNIIIVLFLAYVVNEIDIEAQYLKIVLSLIIFTMWLLIYKKFNRLTL